jgi:para-nitrobenzyl esterase
MTRPVCSSEPPPPLFSLDWAQLPLQLEHYRQFLGDLSTDSIISDYRSWYPAYSAPDIFFAVTTAFRSWHGMVIESERRARQNGPTWVYNFTWKSPVDGGKWGAPHTIDIPFAFDNLALAASMTGTSPDAQRLASRYADTLLHFARSGDPNHPGLMNSRNVPLCCGTHRLVYKAIPAARNES